MFQKKKKAKSTRRRLLDFSLGRSFFLASIILVVSVFSQVKRAGVKGLLILILTLVSASAFADMPIPPLHSAVQDEVNLLSRRDAEEMRLALIELNRQDVVQIQVAILSTIGNLSLEEASIKLVDAWKLGSRDRSNGILILVVPNDRKVRIEVGRGLEGRIPDVVAKRIVSDQITPLFRQGHYAEGLSAAIGTLAELAGLEYSQRVRPPHQDWSTLIIILAIVFAFILITSIFRRGGPGGLGGISTPWGGSGWGSGSSWGGFGGGSGPSWGGGGSSWSGGGGSFGGGGASGSW